MSCRDCEAVLHPYLDGELPVPDVLATERHLSECGDCRSRFQALEWLRGEIQRAHLEYVPSPAFERRVRTIGGNRSQARTPWLWVAGLAAAITLVLLAPRLWIQPNRPANEILDSHLRSLLASSLVDVPSSDHHTVKPWFQGRIGFSPEVPDLSQNGYVLVGGRVEVINQQRAAALVYKRRAHVINLFIVDGRSGASDRVMQAQGYNLILWTDRGLSYWAVSDLNAGELSEFAQLVRKTP